MHIRNLSQKIEIAFVIKDNWHLPVHKHTHYELQYIVKGSGQHMINNQTYNYQKGDVFLLPPQDNHFFIFNERTAICVVKFHEGFFEEFLPDPEFEQMLNRFSSPNRNIFLSGSNHKEIITLMELLISTHRKGRIYQQFIIKSTLALILALVSKEAESDNVIPKKEKIQNILNYIDKHITEKQLLSIPQMAERFNLSKSYFNQYFTKATGSSFKKYVQTYALNLIAHQFVHNHKSLSELAYQYGFADESHLSNAFKSQFGQSPTKFKKSSIV